MSCKIALKFTVVWPNALWEMGAIFDKMSTKPARKLKSFSKLKISLMAEQIFTKTYSNEEKYCCESYDWKLEQFDNI